MKWKARARPSMPTTCDENYKNKTANDRLRFATVKIYILLHAAFYFDW